VGVPEVWRQLRSRRDRRGTDRPARPRRPPAARPRAQVPPVLAPGGQPPAGPGRLPVVPLVRDLADWAWRLLLLGFAAVVLLWLARRLYLVSLPLAASLILTALLHPAVAHLERRGLPRALAGGTTLLLALGVVGGVLAWVVHRAAGSWQALVDQVSATVAQFPVSNQTLMALRNQLVVELQSHRAELTQGVLSGLTSAAEVLTGVVLTVLLTAILLVDGDRMWAWLLSGLPPSGRARVQAAAWPAWGRLAGWIRGTFLIAVFHGVVIGCALLVLGVPLVAPLAVLVFFGSFIPIFGAVVFGGLAVLLAFGTQGITTGLVMLAVLVVENQVEAHVLQPFLVGRYVRLHAFVVALVITAGGLLWGIPGALLAVPVTAAVHAAVTHLHGPVSDVPAGPDPP
jgi:putative heme transporter